MYSIPSLPSFAINIVRTSKPKSTGLHRRKLQIRAMRAVVQRVTSASVEVKRRIVSEISPGLLVLVGHHESVTDSDADYMVASHVAVPPQNARPFYDSLVEKFRKSYSPEAIQDGVFGAMMKVNLLNNGPVTMQLDSSQSSHRVPPTANLNDSIRAQ